MNKLSILIKCIVDKPFRYQVFIQKGLWNNMDDKKYIQRQFYARYKGKRKLDLDNPKTLCEKLNWLKLYDRKPYYTNMVDKYLVKEKIASICGREHVIPTIGVWDRFEDINFSELPEQFVIKCTHDSGSVILCKNKEEFDYENAKKKIESQMNKNLYLMNREWVYKDVKPRIICEPYINSLGKMDSIEYKLSTFNGKVKFITVCRGIAHDKMEYRTNDHYDTNWNPLDFYVEYKNSGIEFERPPFLDKLIQYSEEIAKDTLYLRVDWYVDNGTILFGETTFYTWAGYMTFVPEKWDGILGSWLQLPDIEEQ